MKELIIDNFNDNQRLDKFLLKYLNEAQKSFIYKMLRKKNILLNKKKAFGNEILLTGDKITFFLKDETIDTMQKRKDVILKTKEINIVYEDENIIICNKESGILSQSDKTSKQCYNDMILSYLYKTGQYDISKESVFTPSISNRLDRNTSGLIIATKNLHSAQAIREMFVNNQIKRFYTTLVNGAIKKDGNIKTLYEKNKDLNIAIIKDLDLNKDLKEVQTIYTPIKAFKKYTLLKVELITGKSHQIRVHLNTIGNSIVGDNKYGNIKTNKYFMDTFGLYYQLLHCETMVFENCLGYLSYLSGKTFNAKRPEEFNNIIKFLENV